MTLKHFSSWTKENIKLDEVYQTSWAESNYWKNKQTDQNQIKNTIDPLFDSLNQIFKMLGKNFDTSKITDEIQKSKYYSELLKEYIFEDIRICEFPDKPSRKKCMFLSPNEIDIKDYAKRLNFDVTSKTFLQIETLDETKLHFADLTLLNCNSKSHAEKLDFARQYWKGTDNRNFDTEVLLTGPFKISKII